MHAEADAVRAYIARGRVAEMLARGWRILGPQEESAVLMEGPDPAPAEAAPQRLGALAASVMENAWERATARRDEMEPRWARAA